MIFPGELLPLFFPAAAVLFLILIGNALRKRNLHQPSAWMLVLFLAVSLVFYSLIYLQQTGRLEMFNRDFQQHLPHYALLLLSWFSLGFTLAFLRTAAGKSWGWLLGLVPAAALILLDANPINLPDNLWSGESQVLPRLNVSWYGMQAAWISAILLASLLTLRAHRQAVHPLHRNRIVYLLPVLILFSISAAFFFGRLPAAGYAVHFLLALLITYISLTHQLPDLRSIFRQLAGYLILFLLTAALFSGVFFLAGKLIQNWSSLSFLWLGIGTAAVVAVFLNPLLALARKIINRLLAGPGYNPTEMIREYSRSISNILDMELLAAVVVGSIREDIGISRGHLLLVEKQEDGEERGYRLANIHFSGNDALEPGLLAFNSPVAMYLLQERKPLTQYDIDMLPAFRSAPRAEHSWLSSSGMDVYLPILAHDEWIGLLAVGPKSSGDRYYDDDLALLSALASQTAVSLENARLVKNLVELNDQLRRAYDALNSANQKLEKLDQAKTDFISIASHELRTPLTLLMGYIDMLAADPTMTNDEYYRQVVSGMQTGTSRLHEIVSAMLDMAKIDSRVLDLSPKSVALPGLIRDIQSSLSKAFLERSLTFEVLELTNLPMIEADPEALAKVFYHLIINAVKYTPDGGQIKVVERLVPAAQSLIRRDSVEVIISDTGIGIDPDMLELIFTKFYHTGPVDLHSTGKTKFKGGGPGLGLAIVRGIVEAHNGRVWAESAGYDEKTNPGCQFHVLLPVKQKVSVDAVTMPLNGRNRPVVEITSR